MKKATILLMLIIGLGSVTAINAQTSDTTGKSVELYSAEKGKSKELNAEVKGKKPTTDVAKKNPQTEGTYTCDLRLENRSSYYVEVYLDGYWYCTLSPNTYVWAVTPLGYNRIYAESSGGTKYWAAQTVNCTDVFTYRFW